MSMKRFDLAIARRQRGAVLFVAMIFLILITVMAVTASWNSVLQERMTGGMRNRQMSMLGAESALRFGEAYVWNSVDRANFSQGCLPLRCNDAGGQGGCYKATVTGELPTTVQTFRTNTPWVASAGLGYTPTMTGLTGNLETASLAAQPRYIIEELGAVRRSSIASTARLRMSGADNDRGKQTDSGIGARTLYRVTARSLGGSDAVLRMAEATFEAKKISSCNPN